MRNAEEEDVAIRYGSVRTLLRRRMPVWLVMVLSVVLVVATVTFSVTVTQTTLQAIFGEVTTVGTSFTASSGGVSVTAVPLAAAGATSGTAIELALVAGTANTATTLGNWKYTVTVTEASAAAVTSGTYTATLYIDGTSQGALFMTQGTSDAANAEGVTFSWDIGSTLATGAKAYVVKVV